MEIRFQPPKNTFAGNIGFFFGFLIAWIAITLALTLGSRILNLGPGFSNPLPYAGIAMIMAQTGRLLRKWVMS